MNLGRIQIPTDNNLKLQNELYNQITNELTEPNTQKTITWNDNNLICLRTKQGVIKIKTWEEQFQKYACWKFTKKQELQFDKYE